MLYGFKRPESNTIHVLYLTWARNNYIFKVFIFNISNLVAWTDGMLRYGTLILQSNIKKSSVKVAVYRLNYLKLSETFVLLVSLLTNIHERKCNVMSDFLEVLGSYTH